MSFEQLDTLEPLLKELDERQARVNSLKQAHPDAYSRILNNWAIESTYNSNNIEGSTLSLGDTALVFDGAEVSAPQEEIAQAEGGFAALRFLYDILDLETFELTEKIIKRGHELLFAEAIDARMRGAYRQTEVEISGTPFEPTPAQFVEERMASLVRSVNKSKRHPATTAALFHLEFESIHPFVNANGRTGRLISNMILMGHGLEPVNIQAESRPRYIQTLRSYQLDDNPYPFVRFFCLNLESRQKRIEKLLTIKD